MLDFGADPNLANVGGWTPLIRTTWSKHLDVMRLLIEGGAQVNSISEIGKTALCRAQSVEAVKLLLKYGSDPRIRNSDGNIVFHEYDPVVADIRHLFEIATR